MKRLPALVATASLGALLLAGAGASSTRAIVANQDWWPVWSPTGAAIAFTRIEQGKFDLDVVTNAGQHYRIVSANPYQPAPSWSSDGRLAFSLGGKIYTSDATGAHRTLLFSGGRNFAPAWRPHSSDIAYLTTQGAQNTDLWVGGALWARDAIGIPAWSPDGTRLAFAKADGIYVTMGPGQEQRVASTAEIPGASTWSPDGTQLAYTAGGYTARQVFVVPADGSAAPRALSEKFAVLSTPGWSPTSGRVVYTGDGRLWASQLVGRTRSVTGAAGVGAAISPVQNVIAFAGRHPRCAGHSAIREYFASTKVWTLTGSCVIRGAPHADKIAGTSEGGDIIRAGAGNDRVYARNGRRDVVDCGPGRDRAWVDKSDVVRHCEVVHRG